VTVEQLRGYLYDYPAYYDLVYGSDCRAEVQFFQACIRKHARRPVRRVFEPACGTGRLLLRLAGGGYRVSGNDLCEPAVRYCNRRLARHGFPPTAEIADMADFTLPYRADAALNTIGSFRHLLTEEAATAHLRCMSRVLETGGIYIVGLHLTPLSGTPLDHESWSARRGHLAVCTDMRTVRRDCRKRVEVVRTAVDVFTPTRTRRIVGEMRFRTYTHRQFERLLGSVPSLRSVATYDFSYDVRRPIQVDPDTEDVAYVLVKEPSRKR